MTSNPIGRADGDDVQRIDGAYWLARKRSPGFDKAAEADFEHWLAESEANSADYSRVLRAWGRSAELAQSPAIMSLRRQFAAKRTSARLDGRVRSKRFAAMALAASAAAALGFFMVGSPVLLRSPVPPASPEQGYVTIATGPGEQRSLALADGTRVTVDARSELRVMFTPSARSVRLEHGRAYFAVAHDVSRPFTVAAGNGETRAVGTRFVVDDDHGKVRVSLVEGRVSVRTLDAGSAGTAVMLTPGHEAVYQPRSAPKHVGTAKSADPLDWTRGMVSFTDVPLEEAARRLSRYTAQPIVVDASARDRAVTGVFSVANQSRFAETLAAALALRVVEGDDGTLVLTD